MNFDSSEYINVLLDNFVKKYPQYSYSKLKKNDVDDKIFSIMNKTGVEKNCKTVSWDTKLYVTYIY
jgi:hypothetical protein|tara:strand:- start:90 stop:287 length:198 start_codon:yes stop_codon:yes gene_type:complete